MENNNNSRPVVKFSSSQTRITLYEEEIDRRSLIWYNAADLKQCYTDGHVSKEDFAAALRAHQAAVDATKSPQREAAAIVEIMI